MSAKQGTVIEGEEDEDDCCPPVAPSIAPARAAANPPTAPTAGEHTLLAQPVVAAADSVVSPKSIVPPQSAARHVSNPDAEDERERAASLQALLSINQRLAGQSAIQREKAAGAVSPVASNQTSAPILPAQPQGPRTSPVPQSEPAAVVAAAAPAAVEAPAIVETIPQAPYAEALHRLIHTKRPAGGVSAGQSNPVPPVLLPHAQPLLTVTESKYAQGSLLFKDVFDAKIRIAGDLVKQSHGQLCHCSATVDTHLRLVKQVREDLVATSEIGNVLVEAAHESFEAMDPFFRRKAQPVKLV